jgi:hypothetical protein
MLRVEERHVERALNYRVQSFGFLARNFGPFGAGTREKTKTFLTRLEEMQKHLALPILREAALRQYQEIFLSRMLAHKAFHAERELSHRARTRASL